MTTIVAKGIKDGIEASLIWDEDENSLITPNSEDQRFQDKMIEWTSELLTLGQEKYDMSGIPLKFDSPIRAYIIMLRFFDDEPVFFSDPPLKFLTVGLDSEVGAVY